MMQKQLHTILANITYISVVGNDSIDVHGFHADSRAISQGMVFVASRGTKTDGHSFIESAIAKGAVAVICEQLPTTTHNHVCYIVVENSAIACGNALKCFYGIDFSTFKVVGVTGTNGKTTTATLLYDLFQKLHISCGLLSTVCNYIGNEQVEATHTTPDTLQLYALFYQMIQKGCTYCFMEVSSHAIHQHRIAGVEFAGCIFTNITQDHLDYHKTFAEYLQVKKSLFDTLPSSAFALTNIDDKNGSVVLQNTKARKYSYSLKNVSDYKCKIIESHFDGMLLEINGTQVWTKFIGAFNAYNILSVYATAMLLGQESHAVLAILSMLNPVDGRIQFYRNVHGTTAIVDYAHTPDALENVLTTIKKLCTVKNKIITVVGAGGDRDKTKRPIMGKIAAKISDRVIITSDNPRSEEPAAIAQDMYQGIEEALSSKVLTILDRKEAIKTALMLAGPHDIVLVAGKGHETYQEIHGVKHHFDDREIIQELFKS